MIRFIQWGSNGSDDFAIKTTRLRTQKSCWRTRGRSTRKIDATVDGREKEGEGGGVIEANYKGRITGSWATRQPSLSLRSRIASERAIHVARELFVLRRIGNIIIEVIASQNPSRIQRGDVRDEAVTGPRHHAWSTWYARARVTQYPPRTGEIDVTPD